MKITRKRQVQARRMSSGSTPYCKQVNIPSKTDLISKTVTSKFDVVDPLSLETISKNVSKKIDRIGIKKKDRIRMKRDRWIETLAKKVASTSTNNNKKTHQNNDKRSYMHLKQLNDALEVIDDEDCTEENAERKPHLKGGKEIQDHIEKIELIMKHPEYAKNPLQTIKRHLLNVI